MPKRTISNSSSEGKKNGYRRCKDCYNYIVYKQFMIRCLECYHKYKEVQFVEDDKD